MPRLTVITASTRPNRVGAQVTDWFTKVARDHGGFDVHLVDLAQLDLPFLDEAHPAIDGLPYDNEQTRRWSDLASAADAFVIVTPEYNHGYPAPLKNALDHLYREWNDKPVAFVSYGMTSGGLRAVHQLKPVVTALRMVPVADSVVIHLRQALDAAGRLTPTPAMENAANSTLDELLRIAPTLTVLRSSPAR
ncbi:NAD(P)H-dependent oxidoreductase [Hamadaea sp. NPDC050747]|uniref:NADPH-dependent FMN reductase n=1 Tax=Hamadaea sp. NPDC050747 TaxID=3155789 RepID=UPI0033E6B27A